VTATGGLGRGGHGWGKGFGVCAGAGAVLGSGGRRVRWSFKWGGAAAPALPGLSPTRPVRSHRLLGAMGSRVEPEARRYTLTLHQNEQKRPCSAYSGDSGDSDCSGHCVTATLFSRRGAEGDAHHSRPPIRVDLWLPPLGAFVPVLIRVQSVKIRG